MTTAEGATLRSAQTHRPRRSAATDTDQLARTAITTMIRNWRGQASVPSRSLYPHQWSWDSAFIALGLQHWAPKRAAAELLTLLGAQWTDGRVPHIVFNPAVPENAYFPGPAFWRSGGIAGHPPVPTSGIIQPPVHAIAAAEVTSRLGRDRTAFAERIYPALVAQNAFIRRARAVSPAGLAVLLHPWETGMDNSPAWDQPLEAVPADLSLLQSHTRRDLDHAGYSERPTDVDYARYIRLAADYRDHGYDDAWAVTEAEFGVVDPGFNALWGWSELALAQIAEELGQDPRSHLDEAARITAALTDELLHPSTPEGPGFFQAMDLRTGATIPEICVNGALPLLLPGLAPEAVTAVVTTLTGPAFGVGDSRIAGVVSYDLTGHAFDPQRYWRGPTWLNTTWLVARGLRTHGHDALADHLDEDLLGLVRGAGLREYFNPHTGAGHGTKDFSWSAALLLDVLARHSVQRLHDRA
jgi:glycogen debranching enzyme